MFISDQHSSLGMKSLTYGLGIFAFLANIGDLVTTLIALPLGGVELNPLFSQFGYNFFFLIKIIFPTLFIIGCLIIAEKKKNWVSSADVGMGLIGILFLSAFVNNLIVIFHLI